MGSRKADEEMKAKKQESSVENITGSKTWEKAEKQMKK